MKPTKHPTTSPTFSPSQIPTTSFVSSIPYGIQTNILETSITQAVGSYTCNLCHTSSVLNAVVSSADVISSCSISDAIFAGIKLNGSDDDTISVGAYGYTSVAFNTSFPNSCSRTSGCTTSTSSTSNTANTCCPT